MTFRTKRFVHDSAITSGLVVMPKRWVVERTHAWNEQTRRLIMHHHRLFDVSAARVWLAEARMLTRRLTTRFCLQPLTDALAKAGTM